MNENTDGRCGRCLRFTAFIMGQAKALPAGFVAGVLWDHINPSAPSFFSAAMALIPIVLIIVIKKLVMPKEMHA